MKTFATGADGLLGSYLVRALLEAGHEVRALVQPNSPAGTLDGLPIEKVEGDLLAGRATLARAIDGCEAVFHCAAIAGLDAPDDLVWRVNYGGTKRLLDLALKAGVERFVFVGSASSYAPGTKDRPGDERGPFPDAYRGVAYMESKYQATQLVRDYVARGLDAVIVVPTFMLGIYDARPSSGALVQQCVTRPLPFAPDGGRNFTHARDVARAMVNALTLGRPGESYILGGENLSYLEFFTAVARAAGTRAPRVTLPRSMVLAGGAAASAKTRILKRQGRLSYELARLSLVPAFYSSKKAERELDYRHTPIDVAIGDALEGLRAHGHI